MKNTLKVTTPSDREIVMTRSFNAPRRLVWEAMSKPELIKLWLFGPPGWTMTQCDDDQRVGGKFRWAWRGPNDEQMAMFGEYREVVAPEKVSRTEIFEMGSGQEGGKFCTVVMGEQFCTIVLKEEGNTTLLTLTVLCASKEARDATIASGMEHGVAAGYDRLEEMLALK